MSKNIDFRSK